MGKCLQFCMAIIWVLGFFQHAKNILIFQFHFTLHLIQSLTTSMYWHSGFAEYYTYKRYSPLEAMFHTKQTKKYTKLEAYRGAVEATHTSIGSDYGSVQMTQYYGHEHRSLLCILDWEIRLWAPAGRRIYVNDDLSTALQNMLALYEKQYISKKYIKVN